MNITIINDCRDANAIGRQTARTSSLLNGPVSFIGVASDIQAAGNIIDILDALEENHNHSRHTKNPRSTYRGRRIAK